MPTVTINAVGYPSYITVADADAYLAADMARAAPWEAVVPDDKSRAVVSATRLLQRMSWRAGSPPDTEDPALPQVVKDATALLAADIAAKPAVGDGGGTGSNVKSVTAKGTGVEFFRPTEGTPLPSAAWALLGDLLGPSDSGDGAGGATENAAYGSEWWRRSRFDRSDYGLLGGGYYEEPFP